MAFQKKEDPFASPIRVNSFKGINNRLDPTALGLEWQVHADNVLCDNAGYLQRRPGLEPFATGLKDCFATQAGRLFGIDASDWLVSIESDGRSLPLFGGITGAPFRWAELGTALFLQSISSDDRWAIYPNRVIPWGSLCPPSPVEEYPLVDPIAYPPPKARFIAACRNRLVLAVWEPERDRSVLFFSRPDYPHEFRLEKDYILIPGAVHLLASVQNGVVVGTDRAIYLDTPEGTLQQVADFGVPVHDNTAQFNNQCWFFSYRGFCKAAPFELVTDTVLVPECRQSVSVGVLPYKGGVYTVAMQKGAVDPVKHASFQPMAVQQVFKHGLNP